MDESISTALARERFADVLNEVAFGKRRIGLTRHGKRVAVVVPVEDADLLEWLEDQRDLEEARRALEEARRDGTTPFAAFRAELGV